MSLEMELQNLVGTFFGNPSGLLATLIIFAALLSLTSCSPDPRPCPYKHEGKNWGKEPSKYFRP